MKRLFTKLFKFQLLQFKRTRRWMRGTFYLIRPKGLAMAPFWSDTIITSCQSTVEATESW